MKLRVNELVVILKNRVDGLKDCTPVYEKENEWRFRGIDEILAELKLELMPDKDNKDV